MATERANTIRRADYTPPAWLAEEIELDFELDPDRTLVTATTRFARNSAGDAAAGDAAAGDAAFRLDGDGLELVAVELDGEPLARTRTNARRSTCRSPRCRIASRCGWSPRCGPRTTPR